MPKQKNRPKPAKVARSVPPSRSTRRLLAEAGSASRTARAEADVPTLALALPALAHRMPLIPVATPPWVAAPLNPWRRVRGTDAGDEPEDYSETLDVTLLDGRRGQLTRRVSRRPGSALQREVFFHFERDPGRRLYDLSSLSLPLHGVDDAGQQGPVVLTEGVPAVAGLRAQGIRAFGTLSGPYLVPAAAALRPLVRAGAVLLWPLPDAPGRAHVEQIAGLLTRLGVKALRIVTGDRNPAATNDAQQVMQQAVTWRPSLELPPPRLPLPRAIVRVAHLRLAPEAAGEGRLARPATAIRMGSVRRLAEQLRPRVLGALRAETLSAEQRRQLMDAARRLFTSLGVPLEP